MSVNPGHNTHAYVILTIILPTFTLTVVIHCHKHAWDRYVGLLYSHVKMSKGNARQRRRLFVVCTELDGCCSLVHQQTNFELILANERVGDVISCGPAQTSDLWQVLLSCSPSNERFP